MNQKEIKLVIFLMLFPIWLCYELLLTVFKIIKYLSGTAVSLERNGASFNFHRFSGSLDWSKHILLFLVPVVIGAAIMSENGIFSFWEGIAALLLVCTSILAFYQIYIYCYFNSEKFNNTKREVKEFVKNCNDLNEHISELGLTNLNIGSSDYGNGFLHDQSNFNFKRQGWEKIQRGESIYNCSSSVVKNAANNPFKYLCKYFNVNVNEETLSKIEAALNDVLAANQGRILLERERERVLSEIENPLPFLILRYSKERLMKNLGFKPVALNQICFPIYTFRYVSPGGNSSYDFNIELDFENLEKFIIYLGEILKFRKTVAGQRALMTQSLREKIKYRDKHTCQLCGLSVMDEKNILLEIDHIIPLSKGGFTSEDNLQTLCWKCNRSKGSKII